jgi:hypothetical protein
MSELNVVKEIARQLHLVPSLNNTHDDDSLWYRSQRIGRNVDLICKLPELTKSKGQIDQFCLKVAAYFYNVGHAHQLRADRKAKSRLSINNFLTASNPLSPEELLDICLRITDEKLKDVLDKRRLDIISRIITESNGNFARMTEAMILSDAKNLDDMGAAGLFNDFKHHVVSGKSISSVLDNWKRKVDYQYWQGRLKDSFKFESVRRLAAKRLSTAEHFMEMLHLEHAAEDFDEIIN